MFHASFGAPLAAVPGGGISVAGVSKPSDGGPPVSAMAVFDTLVECVNRANDLSYDLDILRERLIHGVKPSLKPILPRLRNADPTSVPARNPARGEALKQWLNSTAPTRNPNAAPVKWDIDAPESPGENVEVGYFRYELVEQLSKDLDLDELRCLELVKAVVSRPRIRRVLEEALELGSGSLDATDSTYAAATELFYLEQGALSSVLLKLLQLCHKDMDIDEGRRRQLQDLVNDLLLEKDRSGLPSLAEALPDTVIQLTREIRKLRNQSLDLTSFYNPVVSRRRRFLRTQRLQLTEALFYLYETFPRVGARGIASLDGGWVTKLVDATKELALDPSFFLSPEFPQGVSPESALSDELDDRPGIMRVVALLQLATVCALGKNRTLGGGALASVENHLGIQRGGGGFLDWENRKESDYGSGRSGSPEEVEAAAIRVRNYLHYASLGPQRQRRCKPEVHSVQGFAWLTLLVTQWTHTGTPVATEEECNELFKRALEHFAATWFTRVLVSFARVDACNSSDFRSRPEQMVLQPYVLDALATVIVRLRALIDLGAAGEHLTPDIAASVTPRVLALPRPLSEYRAHQEQSEDAGVNLQEQDGLEEVVGMYSEFAIVYGEEPDRLPLLRPAGASGEVEARFDAALLLRGLMKETEELASQRFAPQGDKHPFHYLLYATHSRLMEAAALTSTHASDVACSPIPDELLDGTVQSAEQPYWRFWCDAPVYINRTALTLGEVGVALERLKEGSSYPPESRQLMTASLIRVWIASLSFVLAALSKGLDSPPSSMSLRDRVCRALFPEGTASRDACPPLINRLFWLCSSATEWWSTADDEAATLVPALRGVCFKVLASWAADQPSRLDTLWTLMTSSDTALLPDLLRPLASAHSSGTPQQTTSLLAGVHVNLMKRLERGRRHAATDGLLCLLKQVLPWVVRATSGTGGRRAAGVSQANRNAMMVAGGGVPLVDATAEDLSFRKQGLWLRWAMGVFEHAVCASSGSFSHDGERYKLASRALQVFLDVLESGCGAVRWSHDESSSDRSPPASAIMFEMLSRTVLLKQVLSIVTNDMPTNHHRDPAAASSNLNAASALDEYCALQSRLSVREILVQVPRAPEVGAASAHSGPASYPSKPLSSAQYSMENWGWWRQRSVLLSLAFLAAVAKREDEFIDSWIGSPKQPRAGVGMRHPETTTPHRLGDRLLHAEDPRPPLQALAYLTGYKRHTAIPVLASALLSHLTRTHGQEPTISREVGAMSGGRMLDALFVTDAQAEALVGHVSKAFLGDGLFPPEAHVAWKPAADVDFVDREAEEATLLSLARILTHHYSFLEESVAGPSVGSVGEVQLAVLEMLLGPLRDGLPSLPMAFLGLDERLCFKECLRAVLLLIALFNDCSIADQAVAAPLAEKCYELVFRVCAAGEALSRLEYILAAIQDGLADIGRNPYFFYVPSIPAAESSASELIDGGPAYHKACLDSIAAWHLKTSSLALASACACAWSGRASSSSPPPPREVVTKLMLEQPSLLLNMIGSFFLPQVQLIEPPPSPSFVHAALRSSQASSDHLINLGRFRTALQENASADSSTTAEAVAWASRENVRNFQCGATAGMVHGWESLLEVCVVRVASAYPDLFRGTQGLVALKELLMACALVLEQHPDSEMFVSEPLARSCVILVHQLRQLHPLVSSSGGHESPALAFDLDWTAECLGLLLAALTRRTLRASQEYRTSVVIAFSQLLRHVTHPPSVQDLLLENARAHPAHLSPDAVSLALRHASQSAQASLAHRDKALAVIRETYDEAVGVLARDACCEVAASAACRVASLSTLTLILQTMYEDEDDAAHSGGGTGGGDGSYLSAKVLQSLWSDHHLERFVSMATSGESDDCAMALLLQVSLTELGANALRELGLVSHLIRLLSPPAAPAAAGGLERVPAETLTLSCRVVSSMLGSLPPNAKLNEDVLRFLVAVSGRLARTLDADQVFASISGLEAATASVRVLAAFVASLDPSRRDCILSTSFGQGGALVPLLSRVSALLPSLAEFPCVDASDVAAAAAAGDGGPGSSLSAQWTRCMPRGPYEENAARVSSSPPPIGLSHQASAGWSCFDDMKLGPWWELFRATALLLRRTRSSGTSCSVSSTVSSSSLVGALTTSLVMGERQAQSRHQLDSARHDGLLLESSLLVLENLLALTCSFVQDGVEDTGPLSLKAGVTPLLPRISALHGAPEASAVWGAVSDSDWFLKKITRLLQDELGAL